jgi:hypothetical protein
MTSTGRVAADVVVLTALGLEYDAVRAHLTDTRQHTDANGTRYEIGMLRSGSPGRVALALIGEGNLAAATGRAIGELTPRAVLFVGVAGGLTDSVALGDVVVATREVARTGAMRPTVHFKPIVSGEVVLDSRDSYLARLIAEHYSDAVAVDLRRGTHPTNPSDTRLGAGAGRDEGNRGAGQPGGTARHPGHVRPGPVGRRGAHRPHLARPHRTAALAGHDLPARCPPPRPAAPVGWGLPVPARSLAGPAHPVTTPVGGPPHQPIG